jgi:hypothetical protein
LNNNHLEKLADLVLLVADGMDTEKGNRLRAKALAIYEQVEKTDKTYSYERHLKIEELKNNVRTANNRN